MTFIESPEQFSWVQILPGFWVQFKQSWKAEFSNCTQGSQCPKNSFGFPIMQKNTKKASCDLSKLRLFQKRVCVCLCVLVCASQYLERHSISQPMNLQKQLSLCIDDDLGYPHYCNFLNCWLHPPFIISIHPPKNGGLLLQSHQWRKFLEISPSYPNFWSV